MIKCENPSKFIFNFSAIHRNSAASGLLIQAIHSRCENMAKVCLVECVDISILLLLEEYDKKISVINLNYDLSIGLASEEDVALLGGHPSLPEWFPPYSSH